MELPSWGDFYKIYKNEPDKCRSEALELGKNIGRELMAKLNLSGDDLETMAAVVNAFMSEIRLRLRLRLRITRWFVTTALSVP